MSRTFKFYRENEKEVMKSLGLKPTRNSGSGWVEKEDGQNDYLICQLKSTDAQSIKVNQKDLRILEHNSITSHKLPVFAIQFLNTGEVWLMVKPEDIIGVSEYITTGRTEKINYGIELQDIEETRPVIKLKVQSSASSRKMFHEEQQSRFNKTKNAR